MFIESHLNVCRGSVLEVQATVERSFSVNAVKFEVRFFR